MKNKYNSNNSDILKKLKKGTNTVSSLVLKNPYEVYLSIQKILDDLKCNVKDLDKRVTILEKNQTNSNINIYNSDGSLTGNRTVELLKNNLTFTAQNESNSTVNVITFKYGEILSNTLINYNSDLSDDYTDRSLIDKGYLDERLSNISTSSIYTEDGEITSNRIVTLGDKLLTFFGETTSVISFSDDEIISHRVIDYNNDYSSFFNNRSLVDKEYVDLAISSSVVTDNYIRSLFSAPSPLSYNSSTGVIGVNSGFTIPTNSQITFWNNKFDTPIGTTAQYIRGDGSLATFPTGGTGTVTSVGLTMPTGFSVSGSPITSSGTFAVTLSSGYNLVTDAEKITWNDKQNTITGGATSILTTNLSVNRVLISNSSGKVDISTITSTELEYLSGVSSNIQNQLNNKVTQVVGKQLSDENYTLSEKNKLAGLNNYDDTAVNNRIEDVEDDLRDNYYDIDEVDNLLNNKVDKESGKGLSENDYTTAEKNKLAGLSNYSLPTASTSLKGGVRVDGVTTYMDGDIIKANTSGLTGPASLVPYFDANGDATTDSNFYFNPSATDGQVLARFGNFFLERVNGFEFRLRTSNRLVLGSNTATEVQFINQNHGIKAGILHLNNANPHSSAQIDIVSTTRGVLFPRMTTTQKNAISNPAEGLIVYDLTLHKLCIFNGTSWEEIH
jgi:hypothetical protein